MATGGLGRENLARALAGFAALLGYDAASLPEIARDGIDNGRIQKFEYCAELFWKYLRSCLLATGRDVPNSPRGTLKAGLEGGVVREAEYEAGLAIYDDRNLCSHAYRQEMIPAVLQRLPTHLAIMQGVFSRLPPADAD